MLTQYLESISCTRGFPSCHVKLKDPVDIESKQKYVVQTRGFELRAVSAKCWEIGSLVISAGIEL